MKFVLKNVMRISRYAFGQNLVSCRADVSTPVDAQLPAGCKAYSNLRGKTMC